MSFEKPLYNDRVVLHGDRVVIVVQNGVLSAYVDRRQVAQLLLTDDGELLVRRPEIVDQLPAAALSDAPVEALDLVINGLDEHTCRATALAELRPYTRLLRPGWRPVYAKGHIIGLWAAIGHVDAEVSVDDLGEAWLNVEALGLHRHLLRGLTLGELHQVVAADNPAEELTNVQLAGQDVRKGGRCS